MGSRCRRADDFSRELECGGKKREQRTLGRRKEYKIWKGREEGKRKWIEGGRKSLTDEKGGKKKN